MTPNASETLRAAVREIPDFPKPGILFKDITPILLDGKLFRLAIAEFSRGCEGMDVAKVAGIDARGFLFGATLAHELGLGFVPIRKRGKLPGPTIREAYALEYGESEIEIHSDAISPGERIVLVDDLLATGGTAAAAKRGIQRLGGVVTHIQFLIELTFLGGRAQLGSTPIQSLVAY